MTVRTVSLDDRAWEEIDPLLRRQVVDGERMTMTRYSFAAAGRFPHHVHEQEQIAYVLSGSVTFHISGTPHPLERNHVLVIPSGVPHSATAGPQGAEVLSVVAPARSEANVICFLEEEE